MNILYRVTGLAETAGNTESSVLTTGDGQVDITVQIYGTIGGATVTVQGTLGGTQFATLDDAFGQPMSYTALPPAQQTGGGLKPVGPAVTGLKVVVTGGTGVNLTADIYMVQKRS